MSKGAVKTGRINLKKKSVPIYYLSFNQLSGIKEGWLEVAGRSEDGSLELRYAEGSRSAAPRTVWNMTSHDAGSHGTSLLRAMLPDRRFPFPKSLYAVEDALRFFIKDRPEATVLDFLRLPRVNLLIADDVGLGKTVEAGLVTRELLLRRRIDFIVITAPPAMTIQWRDELESKLGLSFDIIDRERLFLTATPHNGHSNSFSVTKKAKATQRLRVPVLTMSPELDPFTAAWKRELKRSGHSSLP